MALIQIDGISGTGKTTVSQELVRRGYTALDADEAFGYFGDPKTGLPSEERTQANWIWDLEKVRALSKSSTRKTIYICGGAMNQDRVKDLFAKRFTLVIDDFDTIEHSANIRNLQIAEVKLPNGNSLHVLNHHGHHIHQHKNGDQETMRQCTIIANEVAKLDGKVILTGDFNLSPDSESIQLINNHLRNLSIEHKLKTTRNMLTHKTEVCDYIFASSDVQVDGFAVADEIISDHQVLQLEFS